MLWQREILNYFFDKNYDIEFPELKGAASVAASRQYEEHAELPGESPIDYREVPIGEGVDDIGEDDYYDITYGPSFDEDDPGGVEVYDYTRKMANLKIWLIKNNYTSEAKRLKKYIGDK